VPRDRYPHVWEEFERLMQGGMPRQFENPVRTKSGHERYIAWQNSVIHHQGKIAGVVSFGMDVTERKTAEKRLREIERRSRALLDASAESTMLLDLTGRILAINSTASERFGNAADMVGTNIFLFTDWPIPGAG
jgi:PAS domain-containing protein